MKKIILIALIFTLTFTNVYADEVARAVNMEIVETQEPIEIDKSTELIQYSQDYNKYINHPYGYDIVILDSLNLN